MMNEEQATEFFSTLYGGPHHIPGYKVHEIGNGGWFVKTSIPMATFDGSLLTKLVLLAHAKAVRAEITPTPGRCLKICIWQRQRGGSYYETHPTIHQAITMWEKIL